MYSVFIAMRLQEPATFFQMEKSSTKAACSSLKYSGKTIIGAVGNLNSSNALEIEKVQYRNLLD